MLKEISDGLSKLWQPKKIHRPFFAGGSGKLQVSRDGCKLACLHNGSINILNWDVGDVQSKLSDDVDDESIETVTSFCMHPTLNQIVVSTHNHLLRHYELDNKVCIRAIKSHNMPILTMAYDSTGTIVATGASDGAVRVWDIPRGYCTHSFKDHSDTVQIVRFHPDPYRLQLFSTSDDSTIRIYDLVKNECVVCFREHMSTPTDLGFSYDGYLLISSSRDKVLNFYELRGLIHVKTVPVMEELEGVVVLNEEHSLSIRNHSRLLQNIKSSKSSSKALVRVVIVTAGEAGVLHLYAVSILGKDTSTFVCQKLAQVGKSGSALSSIRSLHYVPSTGEVVSVTVDHSIHSYTISAGEQENSLEGEEELLVHSRHIVGSYDDILDLISIPISTGGDEEAGAHSQVAVVSNSPQVRVFDCGTAGSLNCLSLDGHADIVLSASVSPDGLWLVTSSKDRTCRVWELASGRCCAVGEGHGDAVGCVTISQSRSSYASRQVVMITGAGDKTVKRWRLPLHQWITSKASVTPAAPAKLLSSHSIRAHDKDVNTIALSPNDMLIASGSQDKTIRIWQSSDLTAVATLSGHKRGVWRIVFSPVDRCLASCSGDRTVKLWSMADYTCLRTFQGHTSSVLSVQFVNRGQQLISASSDGLLRLWTIRTGDCENTFDAHQDKVWTLAVASDGCVLSGGSDGQLILWKDATVEEEQSRLDTLEKTLLLEQQMQNDVRNKRFDKALSAAITLGHSNRILGILTAILEDHTQGPVQESDAGVAGHEAEETRLLDKYVQDWSDEEVGKIVTHLKDWNTNAKHCFVCHVLLSALLRVLKVDRLLKLPLLVDALPGLLSYSERHYQRLDRLNQATYMLEYMQALMTGLPDMHLEENEEPTVGLTRKSKSQVSGEDVSTLIFGPLKKKIKD